MAFDLSAPLIRHHATAHTALQRRGFTKNSLRALTLAAALTVGSAAFAIPPGDDVTTAPDKYFLKGSDVADSLALLPPPPSPDSPQFKNDLAQYEWGLTQRNTERGKQASDDAEVTAGGVPAAFSEAFGFKIDRKNTPQTLRLLSKMREDAGDLATRAAKVHYMRQRPFAYFKTDTCNTKDQKKLSTNGSYPSGHTAIGWATALVLAEINPARQNEILKRGFEIGQSRVICGYHWQSDVDAGRIVAAALVAKLHSNPVFNWHLMMAKEEIEKLSH